MKIAHISDTHGKFIKIPRFVDAIVHSGDICPDPPVYMDFNSTALWQENWLNERVAVLREWSNDLPLYFIQGNHDYMKSSKTEEILRSNNINAFNIEEKIYSIGGMSIYGFPWVKRINGMFNYELNNVNMKSKCQELKTFLENQNINILVAHGPMTNGLSNEGFADYGNNFLEDAINATNKDNLPSYMFVGHCHGANGIKFREDLQMLIVNSATTLNVIDI